VNLDAFKPCVAASEFGYEQGRPCIFLKLNKIYNWIPEYFDSSDKLSENMPNSLKTHIKSRESARKNTNVVWVSCEGENPADIENLGNSIAYYSLNGEQGFHGNYFPFVNTKGYLQPLVAVQFSSIKRELELTNFYLTFVLTLPPPPQPAS
jgi:sodium/potassium-transporting ATPase subunit beta